MEIDGARVRHTSDGWCRMWWLRQARDELAKLKQRLFGVGGTNVMAIKAA